MTSDFRVGRFSMIGQKLDMVGRLVGQDRTPDFFSTGKIETIPENH